MSDRKRSIRIPVTDREYELITAAARGAGLGIAAYLRRMALGDDVDPVDVGGRAPVVTVAPGQRFALLGAVFLVGEAGQVRQDRGEPDYVATQLLGSGPEGARIRLDRDPERRPHPAATP
jgi:hypothetical protein